MADKIKYEKKDFIESVKDGLESMFPIGVNDKSSEGYKKPINSSASEKDVEGFLKKNQFILKHLHNGDANISKLERDYWRIR